MGYKADDIETGRAILKEMALAEMKRDDFSKADVVKALSKEILALRKLGYSLEQISNRLKSVGLDIGTTSLKSQLQVKAAKSKVPMQTPKKALAAPQPAVEATLAAETETPVESPAE